VLVEGHDGSVEPVTARVVVGADGVWSRTAELLQSPTQRSHRPTNAVHYAYFSGVPGDRFWFQFTPGLNAGVIPTNDGLSCVFVGRERSRVAEFKADPEAEFFRLLGAGGSDLLDTVAEGSRVSPFRGTPGLPGFMRRPWGPGWALVGDAGYTKDPISAHGISDALRDAELCARAIDAALADPREAEVALRSYEEGRDALSTRMFSESAALAAYRWDPGEASARMRVISDAVREECAFLEALPAWGPVLSRV
jgi:flavin-dependent dehydrogenase